MALPAVRHNAAAWAGTAPVAYDRCGMGARFASLASLLLGIAVLASPVRASEPELALGRLLEARALRGAQVGLVVADLESGEILLEREADRPMVPASNQKLLIAAGALLHWGPTHRFETRLVSESPADASGVLETPLWVVGSGDPSLVSESLWKLGEELRLRGLRELRGGLAIDASLFDATHTHRDWEPLSTRAYHARVSAFAANYSSFRIEITSAPRTGQTARVALAPALPYFRLRAQAPTVRGNGVLQVDTEKLPDASGELVRVSGAMQLDRDPKSVWRSVQLPDRYAASLLRAQLEAHGVRVSGATRFGRAPANAVEILTFEGEPLGSIIQKLNKYSNNFIAEQLVKLLGAEWSGEPGSWESGTNALHELLVARGVIDASTVIADGSGLSPRNRISPSSLLRVILHAAGDFDSGPEFLASLPIGGLDGTLEDRMEQHPIPLRGKTGHLRSVSSLSGLLSTEGGRRLAFSLIINGGRGGREDVDLAVDDFMAGMASACWSDDESGAQGATGD